ncbi:DUF4256 domain-containing protein [Halobacillus sp. BAB-2008]|uniref:DUF4256 domain-containing protein n=1 Tax=Halobacillus sp. BAB-2008 TaxID=1246484 RepID=UPI0002A4FE47|nr:DUF4256 domain-containing protein [Halobacillus sp. BAB-2008]ELK44850.1 hypothetical protein D479_17394 [Halobacillus sp. BAB-2008]
MSRHVSQDEKAELYAKWKDRFDTNAERHPGLVWEHIEKKLEADESKLWSLREMERTGGEPDVVGYEEGTDRYLFFDCSPESPKGRRSVCYDSAALESRKKYKPETSAVDMAEEMGVELLTEEEYRSLQKLGEFDKKTSSWVQTPADIRSLGGALFCDYRYGTVFLYHNGAESYYAARGFRCRLHV